MVIEILVEELTENLMIGKDIRGSTDNTLG